MLFQSFCAGKTVLGKRHLTAKDSFQLWLYYRYGPPRSGKDGGIFGMGMDDRADFRPALINSSVKPLFGSRFVLSFVF